MTDSKPFQINTYFCFMYRLQKVKRKNLDLEKYSKAIQQALNYRIYAEYWYLDILTGNKWECWIRGDYEVVMPVPLQFKFGFKFVLQPTYCQQLGVFYKEEIPEKLFREFEKILHKYHVRSYCFNEENTEKYNPTGKKKVNYVLDLGSSYEEIKKSASKSSKWNAKQFEKSGLGINSNIDLKTILLKKRESNTFQLREKTRLKLSELLQTLSKRNLLLTKAVYQENEVVAFACFIHSKNRIIYINSTSDQKGRKVCAPTGLLNDIIREYSKQPVLLDFEGSTNPNLASFFKGFGGEAKQYTIFSNFRF